MVSFVSGLVSGLVVSGIAGGVGALVVHRRFVRLDRRTREAERLAELGTLTSGLAHEIKNPLSTVQLNLQLMSEDLDPRDENQKRVLHRMGVVRRETARLREILDDFLRYAGKMEIDRQPTDLVDLLEELVDFYAPLAQLQKVNLRLKPPPAPVFANVDARLIKQAVLNLMINALQAMPGGGELILAVTTADGHARIDVIDTGGGIPPETARQIFNAYYSTKRGGTGLGLAISQRVAKEHGGSLQVETEPGKGSDFYLTLPME